MINYLTDERVVFIAIQISLIFEQLFNLLIWLLLFQLDE